MILYLDFETFSKCNLKTAGIYNYAAHPTTRILMLAYAFNDEPVLQWLPNLGPMPDRLKKALTDPLIRKHAHNAQFERLIFREVLKINIPTVQWDCNMIKALSLALPAGLDNLGKCLNVSEDKKKISAGKQLVKLFCMPRTNTSLLKSNTVANRFTDPVKWNDFLQYNIMDVEAERASAKLLRHWKLNSFEKEAWELDQKINDRGIPVNIKSVENAVNLVNEMLEDTLHNLKKLTKLDNPNSVQQLLGWLQSKGYPHYKLTALKVAEELDKDDIFDEVREALVARSILSQSAFKKYAALEDSVCKDKTLKGSFQFLGASRTGRFSGRGFQPHNLKKAQGELGKRQEELAVDLENFTFEEIKVKYKNTGNMLSGAVRTVIQAPTGHVFLDADLSAIENRVLGWVAQDDKILSVFKEGKCPYVAFATYLFNETYEALYAEYKAGDSRKRTMAKPAVLGAGYGAGPGKEEIDEDTGEKTATGLLGYARQIGVDLTIAQCEESIAVFRNTYSGVINYWKLIEKAAKECAATHQPTKAKSIRFSMQKPFLVMHLPSGRNLYYLRPKLVPKETPFGNINLALTYETQDKSGRGVRTSTYGGKLVENAVQALARDLLVYGMVLTDKAGLDICMHVHDQIVCVAEKDKAEEQLQTLIKCMTTPPDWCKDMPLAAEGDISWFFKK